MPSHAAPPVAAAAAAHFQSLIETHSVVRVAEVDGHRSSLGGCNGSAAAASAADNDGPKVHRYGAGPSAAGHHV